MNKNIHLYLLVILSIIMCACTESGQVKEETLDIKDSIVLDMGLPSTMKLYDNKLFLVDMLDDESMVKIFDLKQGKTISKFGKRGQGPLEYIAIANMDVRSNRKNNTDICIYDAGAQRLSYFHESDMINCEDSITKPFITKNLSSNECSFSEVHPVACGFLGAGMLPKYKYTLLSDTMKELSKGGNYRAKPSSNISDRVHLAANYGKTVVSNDGTAFVEIIYMASVISFYKIKSNNLHKEWEYVIHDLDYHVEGDDIINNSVQGYLDAAFDNDVIYCLYSGAKEDPTKPASYGQELHVFSLDGKLLYKYNLQRQLFAIQVDSKSKRIYALAHEPEPKVYVYDLPE